MTDSDSQARRLEWTTAMIETALDGLDTKHLGRLEVARRRRAAWSVIETSESAVAVFGRARDLELSNAAWRALFHHDVQLGELDLEHALQSDELVHVPELAIDPAHRLLFCAASMRRTRGRLGAPAGTLVVCTVITGAVVARMLGVATTALIASGFAGDAADFCSPAWRACIGALPWYAAVHPDDLERCRRALDSVVRTRRAAELEARFRCENEQRWHRIAITVDGGRWFITAADIHASRLSSEERAELLASALEARAEAELATRRKDEFLAAVSHELRAPVTTMLLWDKVLRDGGSDERLRAQALDAIHDSAIAQSRLVGDLLDIARAISGKLHVDLRAIDVNRIVAEALQGGTASAVASGITVIGPATTDVILARGDAFRVRQIVDNLLSNAVKFTDRGGTISISISFSTRSRTVMIVVADSGRGIAAGFLDRIFEPFSQSDNTFTRSEGGLGLGLAISKQLVELQHGTLTASSPGIGLGSTFSMSLPSAGRADSPTAAAHSPALALHRIVIVDDDRRVLEALSLLLERAGAIVMTADSAERARRVVADGSPDLLLCDIAMPGEDGYTFISRLRASGIQVPSIALTAHAMQEDAARALAAGFDAHLAKPIDFERLVAKIAQLIDARR